MLKHELLQAEVGSYIFDGLARFLGSQSINLGVPTLKHIRAPVRGQKLWQTPVYMHSHFHAS